MSRDSVLDCSHCLETVEATASDSRTSGHRRCPDCGTQLVEFHGADLTPEDEGYLSLVEFEKKADLRSPTELKSKSEWIRDRFGYPFN